MAKNMVLFYMEDGKQQDKALHAPLLAQGEAAWDTSVARKATIQAAADRLGIPQSIAEAAFK